MRLRRGSESEDVYGDAWVSANGDVRIRDLQNDNMRSVETSRYSVCLKISRVYSAAVDPRLFAKYAVFERILASKKT